LDSVPVSLQIKYKTEQFAIIEIELE